ncbi:divalent cation transporter [Gillisia sp. M10.2A]|uniref:Divalent cation transporter n=1 Tax=Gillisia lutea TaxID=2909668 RepID=A0ABS9ECX6_9FLAO|nr:divalent cation transporter [Gillisia lutea]MCF4100633.1 divalent cation transporter [Gillisia lutea]
MSAVLKVILLSSFSGITVFLGGVLSKYLHHKLNSNRYKTAIFHSITAFGAGIILSALALVLVPEGMENLKLSFIIFLFLGGAISFFIIDRFIAKKGGKAGQLLAMLMDFIPEAIVLGAVFATDPKTGTLLAVFIGLQNLPESFNSYQDLIDSGMTSNRSLFILFLLSFSGIAGALGGYYLLTDFPSITSGLMMFASGGILYLIFQDIAPKVPIKQNWLPALGANLGFLIGIIGEKLI